MLTSLLSEAPNLDSLQEILMHTNIWIESPKIHERERAIKSTRYLLKFVSEQTDFDTTADFYLLGQLVALLGLHIGDSVKEIGQTSAEAAYHLHCIILNKMAQEMAMKPKNKKGHNVTWAKEDLQSSSPGIFYNDISIMAKAFGEHLSPINITDLMLKIIEALTHEEKTICQAAGVLLLSFLEECCMDMEEVPKILREIYHRLPNISEPATKQNTLKSVCHLASKWVKEVVDFLLERSPDCDQSAGEIWRALTEDPFLKGKLLRALQKRLRGKRCRWL
ncbi:maestro heat-like repeat family member 5 [Crotalus tigris]|uniref:maestro heat-like repeat family member 5 n=1 Tax=Crotalus tigris TaxID=88082 RepID=UPI00192F55A5|nr:maestro heat-like repeat family member 5 [Crotalus tigris]